MGGIGYPVKVHKAYLHRPVEKVYGFNWTAANEEAGIVRVFCCPGRIDVAKLIDPNIRTSGVESRRVDVAVDALTICYRWQDRQCLGSMPVDAGRLDHHGRRFGGG